MLGYVRRWLTRGRLGLRERHNQLDTIVQAEERLSIAAPPVYKLFRSCVLSIQPAQLTELPLRAQPLNASTPLKTVG